jgi:hypothetical protein
MSTKNEKKEEKKAEKTAEMEAHKNETVPKSDATEKRPEPFGPLVFPSPTERRLDVVERDVAEIKKQLERLVDHLLPSSPIPKDEETVFEDLPFQGLESTFLGGKKLKPPPPRTSNYFAQLGKEEPKTKEPMKNEKFQPGGPGAGKTVPKNEARFILNKLFRTPMPKKTRSIQAEDEENPGASPLSLALPRPSAPTMVKFSGTSDQVLEEWLEDFVNYGAMFGWTLDNLHTMLPGYLEKNAKTWWRTTGILYDSFEQVCTELKVVYGNQREDHEYRRDMEACVQGFSEETSLFANRLRAICYVKED